MASHGFREGRRRGSWDDDEDRPRRKRPYPSALEEGEEEGWGGGGPSGSLDKDDRERPPARKARGRPWPDAQEEEVEGRRGGGRWGSPWGESRRGSREPPRGRGRSRSPPRGGEGWRGRGSPSPPRERVWRSPPALGRPDRASRAKGRPSSSSCSPGRDGGRGSWRGTPSRDAPKGRPWELWPKRTTVWNSPQEEEEEGRQPQPPPPSRRAVERGRLERSSSSSSYRSKKGPGWEARQECTQDQSHREIDQRLRKGCGSAKRWYGPERVERGFPASAQEEKVWSNSSRAKPEENQPKYQEADGFSQWEDIQEESGSFCAQSHFDWDHGRQRWDSPDPKGKEQESWTPDEGLELPCSPDEGLEDSNADVAFPLEWNLTESQAGPEALQGGFGSPQRHPSKWGKGPGKRAASSVTWVPRTEVVDFWKRCQSVLKKNVRHYLLSTCPRPTLPDRSCETPEINTNLLSLLSAKQVQAVSTVTFTLRLIQDEVLNMLAPVMTIYEMAEESLEKQELVDPQELREWVRRVMRYIGSVNQRLLLLRRSQVLGAINPRLRSLTPQMTGRSSDGMLFPDDKLKLLKEIIRKFPQLAQKSSFRNFYAASKPKSGGWKPGPPKRSPRPFQPPEKFSAGRRGDESHD